MKETVDRQRLPPPHSGLGQLLFGVAQPALAAGRDADQVKNVVQNPSAAATSGRLAAGGHRVRLQFLEARGERVFLVPEQLDAGPKQRGQRHRHQGEEQEVSQHQNFGLAILRITRIPTISEIIA